MSRYVIDATSPLAGGYALKDTRSGRRVALVWNRRLARLIRDLLNQWGER